MFSRELNRFCIDVHYNLLLSLGREERVKYPHILSILVFLSTAEPQTYGRLDVQLKYVSLFFI